MFGAVTREPCTSDELYEKEFYNTRLGDGRVCIMGGGAGMFYINQCMAFWKRNGVKVTFPELTEYALNHQTDRAFDFGDVPDETADMPAAINAAIVKAGYAPAETPFELYEAFCNSLARLTADRLKEFEQLLGRTFPKLYVISGGSQADGVNQRMARWLDREVYCGLIEAAATGNMLAQLAALDIPVDKNALAQAATNGKMRRFAK
jgi:sugar (pentulose or hexulose) kinase